MTCTQWPAERRNRPLIVAIPSSILSTEHSLEAKTVKIGVVARYLAIFRVDRVLLYMDRDSNKRDHRLARLLLEYAVTPPHLKRRLFPLLPELRAAGLLHPLQIPSHDIPEKPTKGSRIDGIVEDCSLDECTIYLGSWGRIVLRKSKGITPGSVVTLEFLGYRNGNPIYRLSNWDHIYSGFRVEPLSDINSRLAALRRRGYFILGTSRKGRCISEVEIKGNWRGLVVVYGSPYRGVEELVDEELLDVTVNTIPFQGVRTVRTEEALAITLGLLNAMLSNSHL